MMGRVNRAAFGVMGMVLLAGPSAWGTVSAEYNPLAPAVDQVTARFARVQQEIARLQAAGQTAAAAQMQAQLQHFQNELNGTAPSDLTGPALDVIGIYEGPDGSSGNPPPTDTVSVHIEATDRPIVLALGAYNPIQWSLQLDPGVTIAKVILGAGYHTQSVVNLPAGVPVQTSTQFFGYGKLYDENDYPPAAQWLYGQTGLGVSSVQGMYQYSGTPFVVGLGNSDWRAQHVLREMQGLYLQATAYNQSQSQAVAAGYHLNGIYRTYSVNSFGTSIASSAISEMTPLNTVPGSQKPVAATPYEVAIDPTGPTYYGVNSQGAYRINPTTGQTTSLPTGAGVPALSWPTGITFDTHRNRVLMSSLGGEGFLYAYSLQANQWTLVSSLQNADIQALAYLPTNDTLYALPVSNDSPVTALLRYNALGQPLAPLSLTQLIAPTGGGGDIGKFQLMAAGDRLELLTSPVIDLNFPELPAVQHAYLIDPNTGEVTYSGVFPLVPEPGAALGVLALAPWLAARKRRAGLSK